MEPIDIDKMDIKALTIDKILQSYNNKYYTLWMINRVWVVNIHHCKFTEKEGFFIDYCTLRDSSIVGGSPVNRTTWELPRTINIVNPETLVMVTFKITHDIQVGESTLGWSDAIYIGHHGNAFKLIVSLTPQ